MDKKVSHNSSNNSKSNNFKKENKFSDSSLSSDSEEEWGRATKKKKAKKHAQSSSKSLKRAKSTSSSDEDDDDYDDYAESRSNKNKKRTNHERSRANEHLDDEKEDDKDDGSFDDGYDEDLVADDDDRKKLDEMTEKEREQELFNRLEKREILKARYEVEKRLRKEGKLKTGGLSSQLSEKLDKFGDDCVAKSKSFNSASSSEKKPSPNFLDAKLSRREKVKLNKNNDKKTQAMRDLKALRLEKARKEKEKQMSIKNIYSDDDDEDEDEEEAEEMSAGRHAEDDEEEEGSSKKSGKEGRKGDREAKMSLSGVTIRRSKSLSSSSLSSWGERSDDESKTLPIYISKREQLTKIRLSRNKIEKWCHMPFFEKTAIGSFLRMGIGSNQGNPVYRIVQVTAVCEGNKVYQLGANKTNKMLRVKHASQEKTFRLEFVSNSDFTESEFEKWKENMLLAGLELPTIIQIEEKSREINESVNYRFKDTDIDKIVEMKKKFSDLPKNFAMCKANLFKEKEEAEIEGNHGKVLKINESLRRIENEAERIDRMRTSNISAISYINQRNRKQTILQVEQAIVEETASKTQQDDPFTRRRANPSKVYKKRDECVTNFLPFKAQHQQETPNDNSSVSFGSSNVVTSTAASSPIQSSLKDASAPTEDKKSMDGKTDLFTAHDFDIKLDIDNMLTDHSSLDTMPLKVTCNRSTGLDDRPSYRRSINLEDYKRRRGLI